MENLLGLIAATAILVAIPGPNAAVVVASSVQYGMKSGVVTVLGTTFGVSIQLSMVVLGMATVIEHAADALLWIRWAGVVYLLWLGVTTWQKSAGGEEISKSEPAVFWRGFVVAAVNPKTLLFTAAFLPQFVSPTATLSQVTLIATLYLGVLFVGDLLWVAFAGSARHFINCFSTFRNRLTGGFLIAAGIGLALSQRNTS